MVVKRAPKDNIARMDESVVAIHDRCVEWRYCIERPGQNLSELSSKWEDIRKKSTRAD